MKEPQSVIQSTTDYDKFKLLDANRVISKDHVQNLIVSFEAHPELVASQPIIVNDKFEVVDGQHRLEACKALGIPVTYVVAASASITEAQLLNAMQRQWKISDFLYSYARSGNKAYQEVERLLAEYPMNLSALLNVIATGDTNKTNRMFKAGKFDFNLADAEERLNTHVRYLDVVRPEIWRSQPFHRALLYLSKIEGFDHDRMINQLDKTTLQLQPGSMKNYLMELERIFNKGNVSIVRFL